MADVFFDPTCERFHCVDEHYLEYEIEYEEAIIELSRKTCNVSLKVRGWSTFWKCELDFGNNIIAVCPMTEKVRPRVIIASLCGGCQGTGRTHRDLPQCDQPICSSCSGFGYYPPVGHDKG